jgi:hypothetical protein
VGADQASRRSDRCLRSQTLEAARLPKSTSSIPDQEKQSAGTQALFQLIGELLIPVIFLRAPCSTVINKGDVLTNLRQGGIRNWSINLTRFETAKDAPQKPVQYCSQWASESNLYSFWGALPLAFPKCR